MTSQVWAQGIKAGIRGKAIHSGESQLCSSKNFVRFRTIALVFKALKVMVMVVGVLRVCGPSCFIDKDRNSYLLCHNFPSWIKIKELCQKYIKRKQQLFSPTFVVAVQDVSFKSL